MDNDEVENEESADEDEDENEYAEYRNEKSSKTEPKTKSI